MIVDYYKFKLDREIRDNYHLSSYILNSDRIPPERIQFVPDKDKASIQDRYRLVFDKNTIGSIVFPTKNKGVGYFQAGSDLILVSKIPQIFRIHIIIIQDKKMYAEMLYQLFISGLIGFNIDPG